MIESQTSPQPAVAIDEMAFALALFVAAASGKISPPRTQSIEFSLSSSADFSHDPTLLGAQTVLTEKEQRSLDEVPLACAVSVIWHHYDRDERQQAICARLVAFYSLMVRSRGALLETWTEDSDLEPQTVILAPAIVEAVATAYLGESGQFGDDAFKALVQSLADRDGSVATSIAYSDHKSGSLRIPKPFLVTEVVQQLAFHLVAFQSCVVALPNIDGMPEFRALDVLCEHIAPMSGDTSLQTMLSRALFASQAEFPWLASVNASKYGMVTGLENIHPPPNASDAMRCELAILGSLIELLRSLLGDRITLHLLRTLWPLASMEFPTVREKY